MALARTGSASLSAGLAALLAVLAACQGDNPTRTDRPSDLLDISICASGRGPFSATLSNPFFALPAGARWVLAGVDGADAVRLEVSALAETEVVDGVVTRVVEERELVGGEVAEVSRNFFAQAPDGTVCYYGEDVDIYGGGVVVSHDGAWRAGGANRPGIFMPASPQVGQEFQQEVAPGVAMDQGSVVAAGERVTVPLGDFTDTIRIEDFNPLDGGRGEKVYARGVGLLIDGVVRRVE